jgi:hypothetical protein
MTAEQEAQEALDQAMTTLLLEGSAQSRKAFLDARARFHKLCKHMGQSSPPGFSFANQQG